MVTDNSHKFLASLDEIDRFRVTQVATFAECPRRWKAAMLGEGEQRESPYAKMGTAVHLAIEQFLRGDFDLPEGWHDVEKMLLEAGVPPKERLATRDYLQSLADRRGAVLALETAVGEQPLDDAPPIVGHVDCMFLEERDGVVSVTIRDHKTNRHMQPVEWWQEQVQPRLYARMVRRLLQDQGLFLPVYFELGYVNLGVVHRWRTEPGDDYEVVELYAAMIEAFRTYRRTGMWPEVVNENCQYCPLKRSCEALPRSQEQFLGKLAKRAEAGQSVVQRYEFAKHTLTAMQATTDELKGELLAQVAEHGCVQEGDTVYTARKGTRREANTAMIYQRLHSRLTLDDVNDLFSVRLSGLDRLLDEHEDWRPAAEDAVRTIESEEVTLSAKKARK